MRDDYRRPSPEVNRWTLYCHDSQGEATIELPYPEAGRPMITLEGSVRDAFLADFRQRDKEDGGDAHTLAFPLSRAPRFSSRKDHGSEDDWLVFYPIMGIALELLRRAYRGDTTVQLQLCLRLPAEKFTLLVSEPGLPPIEILGEM